MALLLLALMVMPLLLTALNVVLPHRQKLVTEGSESTRTDDGHPELL
ncbi:MAG: hypothetical protein ACLPV4_12560 [Solirubrobacteraceae bacterium]